MKYSIFFLGLFTLYILYGCMKKEQTIDSKLNGMWKLDKFEAFNSITSSWTIDSARIGHQGLIIYDGHGHMGVHLTPIGYNLVDTNVNLDSLNRKELIKFTKFYQSNYVYFANYRITKNTIYHTRLSATSPNAWGTTLRRDFEFKNDTLILTPQELIDGKKLRLRWIKL
jgi:hypothetical protein